MMENIFPNASRSNRDMTESQRALELRKFFAPDSSRTGPGNNAFNDTLNDDGALDAYAESAIWRLHGVHAMISLIDRGKQYFLAGALRSTVSSSGNDLKNYDGKWFGCSSIPTQGGLCEHTLSTSSTEGDYACFTINDLTQDARFANLPVVDGSIAAYRFYAGVPITTNHGIQIGSFFFFDDTPRDGLSLQQRKFFHQLASNVMKHLETKREAAERRRVALMSKGIATFLERTSDASYEIESTNDSTAPDGKDAGADEPFDANDETQQKGDSIHASQQDASTSRKGSVLDKIRMTLDHAADILRESLELNVGGVVFLDTTMGYTETDSTGAAYLDPSTDLGIQVEETTRAEKKRQSSNEASLRPIMYDGGDPHASSGRHLSQGSIRSSTDKHKSSKILAMSAAKIATWDPSSRVLDGKTLHSLINAHPKGNVWYIDEEGYFSSLEQITELEQTVDMSPSGRRKSISPFEVTKQKAEAAMLSQIFYKARQIIFLPLWDASGGRWHSGCFVWSQSAVPVFTVESEISYLSAFTNSVMVEISRLDAITANKMKSDFISSISHEFRSPLHGILASAEFLRDSQLDPSQIEYISTIQNCGGTLLDTINHVLDYSKINSFEKSGNQQGTISNELYQVTNLALLCEDIINGMIAANEFRVSASDDSSVTSELLSGNTHRTQNHETLPLEIGLDIELRDWEFKVQPGAIRRVVMNIFGNAQKYTQSGYILVQVKVLPRPQNSPNSPTKTAGKCLSINVRDSGRGMSAEYMERKLYRPFAQEDSFAPGVGLGLSIVWSIVNQLGGRIQIRSEIGKGTDVEITIPIEEVEDRHLAYMRPGDLMQVSSDAQHCLVMLRERALGKSIRFVRNAVACRRKDTSWRSIKEYCLNWFGFELTESSADLIVTDQDSPSDYPEWQRVLIIRENGHFAVNKNIEHVNRLVGNICSPIGPFKLARSILALLDLEASRSTRDAKRRADAGTQTPLGSPEERTMLNGMIMTDYGFTPQTTVSNTPATQNSEEAEMDPDSEVTTPRAEQDNKDQVLASIRALSGLTLQQPPTRVRITAPPLTGSQKTPDKVLPPVLQLPHMPSQLHQNVPTKTVPTEALRILAVDDNALNLQLLQRYLMKRRADTIVTARNGLEAVAAVRDAASNDTLGNSFDIIFMDISMPEMDGFEATRLIRSFERSFAHRSLSEEAQIFKWAKEANVEVEPRTSESSVDEYKQEKFQETTEVTGPPTAGRSIRRAYIAALTGLASRRDRDEAQNSGFDDFLTKPISFAKIGELLKRLSAEKAAEIHEP